VERFSGTQGNSSGPLPRGLALGAQSIDILTAVSNKTLGTRGNKEITCAFFLFLSRAALTLAPLFGQSPANGPQFLGADIRTSPRAIAPVMAHLHAFAPFSARMT
jgi:hypothetical protein